ncbi:radical SAM domain protein [Candidatus Moduliflexus flocculans]|uniref:Radical SAM domain protein n=1 Tax=Candidatus Moduliflexus flocculans TaxID=1499966 RepID=A0A081BS22_9BACT|nr:radical SAM domain protein [Candidatus Moduliflexus flocculans]
MFNIDEITTPEISRILIHQSHLNIFPMAQCDACDVYSSLIFTGFDKELLNNDHIKTPLLSAWLHLSDACNLHCAYCYLPHAKAEMSIETGRAAIDATLSSALTHGYRSVKFKYAGGEPLLRLPLLLDLHRYARQNAEQRNLALDGVVITNGTLLTADIINQLKDVGLRVTISFDHLPDETHPCPSQEGKRTQRNYPDGRDASADAMRGIETALECGLMPDISITVSGRNVAQLPELLAWVLEKDLPFSLNFYRENACSDGIADLRFEEERFIEGMLAAYKMIEANLPQRSLLASLADMANFAAPHLRRCSVGHSYLVFDTEGRVSKCQMQIDRPVADIRCDDPLGAVRAAKDGIRNLTVDEKEGCQECQWKYWCAGGCPLETYRMTSRYDVKSPHCNIYKALYPEVLRLEGLRLLKYAEENSQ